MTYYKLDKISNEIYNPKLVCRHGRKLELNGCWTCVGWALVLNVCDMCNEVFRPKKDANLVCQKCHDRSCALCE